MKNIVHHFGVYLLFAFSLMIISTPSFSAEKAKAEKIHVSGKTMLDGKPFPGAELYLQTEDWIDGQEVLNHKKIGKSCKDGSFSLTFTRNNRQGQKIIALKKKEYIGWNWVIPKTINESAEIEMIPLDSSFSGIVKDNDGKAMAGVDVRINGWSISKPFYGNLSINNSIFGTTSKTDADGKFSFNYLPGDTNLHLSLSLDGYCYPTNGTYNFKSGAENFEFIMYPEGRIEGRVTFSGTNEPVPGITVLTDGCRCKTDKHGFYRIPKLNEGVHKVSLLLDKTEYNDWIVEDKQYIGVDYGQTTKVNLELKKGILLTGKVIEKISGKPAEGVTVSIHNTYKISTSNRHTVTDKNGIYKFRVLPGEFEVSASGGSSDSEYSNSYTFGENQTWTNVSENDTVKTVDLKIAKVLKFSGRVLYPDGKPAPKVKVGFSSFSNIYTDKNGIFTQTFGERVIGRKFTYIADLPSKELEGSTEIEMIDGGYYEIILHPYEDISIKGKVIDSNNNPVPGVKISMPFLLGDFDNDGRDSVAVSDHNGIFAVEKLRKYKYYCLTAFDGQRTVIIRTQENLADSLFTIVVPVTSSGIWGNITDENGAAVYGANLYISFSNGHKETFSDSLGNYRFDGIFNKVYEIRISSQKYGSESIKDVVLNSENNFVLRDKNRWLNGYVYDKDGKPITGINVSVPNNNSSNSTKTDTNGKFRMRNIGRDIVDLKIFEDASTPKYYPSFLPGTEQSVDNNLLKAPEPFRQEFKGIKTNQEIILKTNK